MKIIFSIVLTCLFASFAKANDERIWMDAKINDKPVRLAFDTGTGVFVVLFSPAAQRLGLKVSPPHPKGQIIPGKIAVGETELCNLDLGGSNFKTSLQVLDLPSDISGLNGVGDGVLGWQAFNGNIFSPDFVSHTITFFTKVPHKSLAWIKLPISTNYDDLTLELPTNKSKKLILAIDSGSSYGVKLNSQEWHEWKLAHTNQPISLVAYYTPNPGLVVTEESWADKISLGSLTLTDVPVSHGIKFS